MQKDRVDVIGIGNTLTDAHPVQWYWITPPEQVRFAGPGTATGWESNCVHERRLFLYVT